MKTKVDELTIRRRGDMAFTLWFKDGQSLRVFGRNSHETYKRLPVEWKIQASHISEAVA